MGAVGSVAIPERINEAKAKELLGEYFEASKWKELTGGEAECSRDTLLEFLDKICDEDDGASSTPGSEANGHDEFSVASPVMTGRSTNSDACCDLARLAPPTGLDAFVPESKLTEHHMRLADQFFAHLKSFFEHRKETDDLWASLDDDDKNKSGENLGDIKSFDLVQRGPHSYDAGLGQQLKLGGGVANTVPELYAAATRARPAYEMLLRRACKQAGIRPEMMKIASLKAVPRTVEKARYEYVDRPGAPTSWISDIVRGSVVCDDQAKVSKLLDALKCTEGVQIIKLSNRFKRPTPSGFRDLNVKIRVSPDIAAPALTTELGGSDAVDHICEVQIHLKALHDFSKVKNSHSFYRFFRHYFRGNWQAIAEQSKALRDLFEAGADSLQAAVAHLLHDDQASAQTVAALAQLADETLGMPAVAAKLYGKLAALVADETNNRRHVEVGVAHLKKGTAQLTLCSYEDAETAFREAMTALQSQPEKYVAACAGLGRTLVARGDFDSAGKTYGKALGALKQARMERHSGVVLSARMELYIARGDYDMALADIAAAEEATTALAANDDPQVALCWIQRSIALGAKAEDARNAEDKALEKKLTDEAFAEVERANEVLHRICGAMSPWLGEALLQKARVLLLAGTRHEAKEACSHASNAAERVKGFAQLAAAHEVHAKALEIVGRTGDARASRRQALAILEASGKGGDIRVRVLMAESAAYAKTSEMSRALDIGEEALRSALDCYGDAHVVVVAALRHVAKLREDAGDLGAALNRLHDALVAAYQLLGRKCPATGTFDERFGVHGFMLKGPRSLTQVASDVHYAVACLADRLRDYAKAVHHYEAAARFVRAARGDKAAVAVRIDHEIQRLKQAAKARTRPKVSRSADAADAHPSVQFSSHNKNLDGSVSSASAAYLSPSSGCDVASFDLKPAKSSTSVRSGPSPPKSSASQRSSSTFDPSASLRPPKTPKTPANLTPNKTPTATNTTTGVASFMAPTGNFARSGRRRTC